MKVRSYRGASLSVLAMFVGCRWRPEDHTTRDHPAYGWTLIIIDSLPKAV